MRRCDSISCVDVFPALTAVRTRSLNSFFSAKLSPRRIFSRATITVCWQSATKRIKLQYSIHDCMSTSQGTGEPAEPSQPTVVPERNIVELIEEVDSHFSLWKDFGLWIFIIAFVLLYAFILGVGII